MAKFETQLLLKIEQGGDVVQRSLSAKANLSIGQHLQNDVIIHGEQFPKKHVLFAGSGKGFRLNLQGYMNGEVIAGDDAKLNFRDMIAHDLLLRKGNAFIYTITPGKRGVLLLGDARVAFQCRRVQVKAAERVSQPFDDRRIPLGIHRDLQWRVSCVRSTDDATHRPIPVAWTTPPCGVAVPDDATRDDINGSAP